MRRLMKVAVRTASVLFFTLMTALAGGITAFMATRTDAQTAPTPGSITYRYDRLGRIVQDISPANSAAYNYDAASSNAA